MEDESLLTVHQVSKKFCRNFKRSLLYGIADMAGEFLNSRQPKQHLRQGEFWALREINLQMRRGEAWGLVGKNGSGKTTLLRIISGLIKPDSGFVRVKGRLAPLIALGAGFNPILTGRENIYANLSILGLTKREIDDRFEPVVEFAEVGEAIDAPLQTYSSGMQARLGFSCAIHTEPDILLIDEVLAVGDIKFRAKCYRRLVQLRESGVSFVLVSHDPYAILGICNTALYLVQGQCIAVGDPETIMARYESDLFTPDTPQTLGSLHLPEPDQPTPLGLKIISILFRDQEGNAIDSPLCGEPVSLCIGCKIDQNLENLIVDIAIREKSGTGEPTLRFNSSLDQTQLPAPPGTREMGLTLPYCGLRPGLYTMKLSVSLKMQMNILDTVEDFTFVVGHTGKQMSRCSFYQPRTWFTSSIQNLEKLREV